MIAADECHAVGVSYFKAKKQEEGLERIETAIDKIAYAAVSIKNHRGKRTQERVRLTHEEIVGVGHVAAHPKQFHEVVELAVNVAAYLILR